MELIYIFTFVIGACVGSFINALLYRYMSKQSLLGRSACTACKHELAWYDLIPVFSWLMLSGRCRYCKKTISVQYPIVELLAGLITLLIAQKTGFTAMLFGVLYNFNNFQPSTLFNFLILDSIFLILLTISIYDSKTKEIPNGFNLIFNFAVIVYIFGLLGAGLLEKQELGLHFVSAIAAFLFFFSLVFFSKETWMGGGDAKLVFGIGLLLGPFNTFVAIFIASWAGAIYGIIGLLISKKSSIHDSRFKIPKNHELPFGPFLALGCLISFLFGSQLIALYVKMFLSI